MGKNHTDEGSRAGKLTKRRKTNLILNSLIAIVLLLIIFVSVNIFFGDSQSGEQAENTAPAQEETETGGNGQQSGSGESDAAGSNEDDAADENGNSSGEEENEEQNEDQNAEEGNDEEGKPVVTEGGSSPDVKQTIVDPSWEPVGTSQSGEHAAVYDKNHVDWQEMLEAISYATGIDQGNMTVWFLGNNGGPNSAAGTVSEKGANQKYRVAIEWVDNEGWKPVKVEELNQ
ncbi:YrrS family protein [Bacillus sp. FJAT-27251]|uniref:YrrS family protein n=1 Tax=Bacillus sp. FJAT-27251 TaxID=1684142 RepID=UPI0006A76194|nr:YrrS family protein [Bacillus sp. FJAT-27251]